jgi:hypothetical protein
MSASIPFHEAAIEWTRRTGEEYVWVAEIYLPKQYDTCEKCVRLESHDHPNKRFVSREELDLAVAEKQRDDYERLHDL